MKKLLAGVLMLALFLSLGLAGGWNGAALAETAEDPDLEAAAGSWIGTMNMAEYVVGETPELEGYLVFAPVDVAMELRADGSYTMEIDAMAAVPYLKTALIDYINDTCEAGGITQAEFEAAAGKSVEALIDDIIAETDLSGANQTVDGSYTCENGKVVFDPGPNEIVGLFSGELLTFRVEGFGNAVLSRGGAVGTWVGLADLREILVAESPDMAPYLKAVPVDLTLELKEDGSYTLSMDAAAMIPAFRDALSAYVEALCEENGMTVADFEATMGTGMEEFLDQALAQLDPEELSEELTGTYTEENGRLTLDPMSEEATVGSFNGRMVTVELDGYGTMEFTRAGFVGLWEGSYDMTEILTEDDEDLAAYLEKAEAMVRLELKADGTYTITIDATTIIPALKDAVSAYMTDLAQEQGMTLEELEEALGTSLDEYLDSLIGEMDLEELSNTENGSYLAKGGRLFFDQDIGDNTEGSWQGSTLTLQLGDPETLILTRR